jgi:ribonuclease P protein component
MGGPESPPKPPGDVDGNVDGFAGRRTRVMDHRFSHAQRVRKRAEFVRIQQSPARITTRHLVFLLAAGGDVARLGVVASRKVGPAVTRNRAKRLVREAFRLHPEVFPAGVDFVIIVRQSPRWVPETAGPQQIGLAELAAEVAGVAPVLARRARDLRGSRAR